MTAKIAVALNVYRRLADRAFRSLIMDKGLIRRMEYIEDLTSEEKDKSIT